MSLFSGALVSTLLVATLATAPAQAAPSSPTPAPSPASSTTQSVSTTTTSAKQVADTRTSATKAKKKAKKRKLPVWRRALLKARSRTGMAYRYGGSGPRAFDCSGLTSWAYGKVGKKLPRTSSAQAGAVKRVKKPKRGDLVFFHNGGRVYHVGLYAGKNRVFHASRPGKPVGQEKIWTRSVFFGRV
ncbi:C40 family peptidase [Nocardioides daphniae]|nr:C40 family peptidase [Nocardioides daphniae]